MIVGRDVNPRNNLYYRGALVLETLESLSDKKVSQLTLIEEVYRLHGFAGNGLQFALDWLFMAGLIEIEGGQIAKCT